MTKNFLIAGIDPGIRASLGLVIFEVTLKTNLFEFKKELAKLLTKQNFTTKNKKELFRNLHETKSFSVTPLFANVFTVKTKEEAVENVYSVIEKFIQVKVVVEDFLFFSNLDKKKQIKYKTRPASYFTVAKMQNFIGYICGFLRGKNVEVSLVKPRTWKSIIEPYHVSYATEFLLLEKLKNFPKSKRNHIFSAVGIGLSEIPNLVRELFKKIS